MLKHEKGLSYMEVLMAADGTKSGSFDIKELMAAIVDLDSVITKDEIQETFQKHDYDNRGRLDYLEIQSLFCTSPLFNSLVGQD